MKTDGELVSRADIYTQSEQGPPPDTVICGIAHLTLTWYSPASTASLLIRYKLVELRQIHYNCQK